MTKKLKFWSLIGSSLLLLAMYSQPVFALDVYAEGAYTDSDLHVYIYADIDGAPLVSFGVKLTYPGPLTVVSAEKNEGDWFLGDGTVAGNKAYMDPDTSVAGEIVFIGGKLDTADPTAGVSGTRVLLGKAIFDRNGATVPQMESVVLSIGRGGNYANFVSNDKTVRDGEVVDCVETIVERGDANADNLITNTDYFKIKALMTSGVYVVYADCNDDGLLTNTDYFCVKNKM